MTDRSRWHLSLLAVAAMLVPAALTAIDLDPEASSMPTDNRTDRSPANLLCARCGKRGRDVRVSSPFKVPLHDLCWMASRDGEKFDWDQRQDRTE